MLKRVYADNYRSLVNFEFQPGECSLLLGDNGSGKSCTFEVIEAIQDIVLHGNGVTDVLPTSSLTRWEARDVQRFELQIEGEEGIYDYTLEVEHDRKTSTCAIRREQVNYAGKTIFRFESKTVHLYDDKFIEDKSFQGDARRSFLAIIEERPENQRIMWFLRFIGKIWVIRPNPLAMTAVSRKEALWLDRDGANFSSWYREMTQQYPEEADLLRADMRVAIEGLQAFRLLASGGTTKDLVATLAARNSADSGKRYDLALDELSLGQRALFMLYAILHFAVVRAKVLCIDEPDNFVALREIQPWLIKLSDALQENNGQLLMISHHPEVIDYLAAGNAFQFERPGGDITRVRPFLVNLESGLKASECIARGWDDGPA